MISYIDVRILIEMAVLSSSVLWVPFLMNMSNFILCARLLSTFTRIQRPIRVAKEQCGTVGLNSMRTTETLDFVGGMTNIPSSYITFRSSNVAGFSGSRIDLRQSAIIKHNKYHVIVTAVTAASILP